MTAYTYAKRYDPASHDIMLFNKWKRGMDDFEIAADFQRQGLDFPVAAIRRARRRLKLVSHSGPVHLGRESEGTLPGEKPDPLAVAQATLPGFDRDTLELYGRWIGLDEAMVRTNRILKARGEPQVDSKRAWVQ